MMRSFVGNTGKNRVNCYAGILYVFIFTLSISLTRFIYSDIAAKVMIELLSTYTAENASQAKKDAERCIITTLADPNTFLLDPLLSLKPITSLKGELIYDLLNIFVKEKLSKYTAFFNANKDFVLGLGG